jgi:antitoxin FitA
MTMRTLTIRNGDPALNVRLRVRAAQHRHSMETEMRQMLRAALKEPEQTSATNLYECIQARFASFGGVDDLELPPDEPAGNPPSFD